MTDFAKLVMAADTTGLKTGVTDLDKLTKAAVVTEAEVQDAMTGIAAATGKVPPAVKEAAEAFSAVPQATTAMNRGFTLGGNGARMMAQQLSQVGQQTMATGNFVQALAIQLPDMGLAFGAAGAAAGLLAGIALPVLMGAFGATGGSAADLEQLIEDLSAATRSFADAVDVASMSATDLRDKVGSASPQMRQLMLELAAIEKIKAYETLRLTAQAAEDLFDPTWGTGSSVESVILDFLELSSLMGSNRDTAAEFVAELDTLANTSDEMARLQAALDLKDTLIANVGGFEAMDDGQRQFLAMLNEIILKEQILGVQSDELAEAGDGIAASLTSASYAGHIFGGYLADARREGTASAEAIREIERAAAQAAIYADEVYDSINRTSGAADNAGSEADALAAALRNAASQASLLASYMGALPGALAGFQAQAHAASAGLAAIKMGLDAAAVSAAEFRGQQEAAAGMLTASEGPGMKAAATAVDSVVTAYENATSISAEFRTAQAAAAAALADVEASATGGGGGAAGGVEALTVELTDAQQAALDFAATIQSDLEGAFDSVSQWFASGFDGGFESMAGSFKSTWADMVSHAIGNPIKANLFGTAASADGSIPASTGILGSPTTGFTGALNASMGGGFTNMFALSSNIAAAGGGLAATLGALVGPLGIVMGLFSAFKTTTTNLAAGLKISVDGMNVLVDEFTTDNKKSFFGLVSSTKTTVNSADQDVTSQVWAIFEDINDAVTGSAAQLGIGAAAFDAFAYDFDVSLKGLSDEEAARAIDQAFVGMSDAMAELAFVGTGVTVPALIGAADYLAQLGNSLTAVNSANRMLGFDLLDTTVAMGGLSEEIVAVYGSIEDFTAATGFYFENFYSREEQIAALTADLDAQMAALNRTTPETMEGFRAMVDAAEAAGKPELAAELINLSDEFANLQAMMAETTAAVEEDNAAAQERYGLQTQLYTLQGKTDLLRERELAALDPTNAALQEQIWALEDLESAAQEAAVAADEAARAAEELAQAEAAIAQERYDLQTQLYTLQGKEDLLRERELALLDPTNAALQEQIWALEDLQAANEAAATAAEELVAAEQVIADERMGLQRQLWELEGNTEALRADQLASLDASNRALQEQIWMLEDQKAALDALDPNTFRTLFDYQKASALAANGYAVANTNVPPAPQQAPVQTALASDDPVVIELRAVKAELALFRTENRDLSMQTVSNTLSSRNTLSKWDGDGLPTERTA